MLDQKRRRVCRPRRSSRDDAQGRTNIVQGRCSLCGRSPEKHEIALIAIHYISSELEAGNFSENLRAFHTERNGMEGCLELPEPAWMGAVMAHASVHMRLGETLKVFEGQAVPAATLKFVANQDGWKTRIRELRYLGWDIKTFNRKMPGGRVSSFYRLNKSKPWPPDPTGTIRQYERERAQRNKLAK